MIYVSVELCRVKMDLNFGVNLGHSVYYYFSISTYLLYWSSTCVGVNEFPTSGVYCLDVGFPTCIPHPVPDV